MRILITILILLLSSIVSAQTATEIQLHRLQYKTDLYNNIKADTSKVDFYPFKKTFIIKASIELLVNQPVFKLTTSSGLKKEAQKYARITFNYNGKKIIFFAYQLVSLKEKPGFTDHFFVPFKDATTGKTSYSAGRYLDFVSGDIKNNQLLIDFNKAYNPYCAFTDGYNCPIPPKENIISIAVTAGEKKYKGK